MKKCVFCNIVKNGNNKVTFDSIWFSMWEIIEGISDIKYSVNIILFTYQSKKTYDFWLYGFFVPIWTLKLERTGNEKLLSFS